MLPTNTIASDYFRFDELKSENKHLSSIQFTTDIELLPKIVEKDSRYWTILSYLVHQYRSSEPACVNLHIDVTTASNVFSPPSVMESLLAQSGDAKPTEEELQIDRELRWSFQVWSLLSACASMLRRTPESTTKAKEAITLTGFYNLHDAVMNGYIRNSNERPGYYDSKLGYKLTAKGLRMISHGDDPVRYIEYTPWEDLAEFVLLSILEDMVGRQFMLWKPKKAMKWEKHLYIEDDILRSCVLSTIEFPGCESGKSVIFTLSEISEFIFETVALGFWEQWVRMKCCYLRGSL